MEFQDHRYWLRTYPNCIVGKELVNWLLRNGTISNRYPATGKVTYLHLIFKLLPLASPVYILVFFLFISFLMMFIFCRAQAIAIGQALVDGRWLDCVTHHDQLFRDEYALYRPLQVTASPHLKTDQHDERNIVSDLFNF